MNLNLAKISSVYKLNFQNFEHMANFSFAIKSSLKVLQDVKGDKFVLKRIHPAYFNLISPLDYFQGLQYFSSILLENNIPLIPYLPTASGKISLFVEDSYYVLSPYVKGDLYSGEIEEVKSIAKIHAKINKSLENLPSQQVDFIKKNIKSQFLRQEVSLTDLYKEAVQKTESLPISETKKLLKANLSLVKEHLNCVNENLYQSFPKQVCHKDIFPGNVLFEDKKVVKILDPDEMMYLPRVRDVMYGIWGFSSRRPPHKGVFPPNIEKARTYLSTYLQEGNLTREEIESLPQVALRIWVEDVLHFSILSDLDDNSYGDLERKITHLKNAINAEHEYEFNKI